MAVVETQPSALTSKLRKSRRAVHFAISAVTLLFGGTAVINLGAFVAAASPFPMTHFAAAALAGYLLVEARLYLRRSDNFGLLSPAFLALILHFCLAYLVGVTVAVFEPWILSRFDVWLLDIDSALANTLLLAMLAAFCMLRGHALGQPLARKLRRKIGASPSFRRQMLPNFGIVLGLQFVYLALVAYAIHLGVYGMLSTPESQARYIDLIQYLNLSLAAGTLSFFLIMHRYFERRELGRASVGFGVFVFLLMAIHVLTGALSAFKSQIVFPFVLGGFAYFLATRRIPLRFIVFAAVALVMAYAIVEPFRAYMNLRGETPSSVSEAVEAIGTAYSMREQLLETRSGEISQGEAIASRFDLSGMTALAVDYVDRGQLQSQMRQRFQDSILLAPILAYVPRAAWPGKPTYSDGVWFNQSVRGRWSDDATSVGMGPIGYLYMAGGVIAVALGFFAFGLLQALIFDGVARAGPGGLIIYLSVANTLVAIPSSFGPAVTGLFRMLPVAFVAQLMLLRGIGTSRRKRRLDVPRHGFLHRSQGLENRL